MSEDKKNIQHMHKNTSKVTKAEEKIVADWVRESRAEDKKWLLKQNDEKQERLKIQGQVLDEKITQEQANTLIKNMHISEGEIYKQELAAFDKLPHAKEAEAILKREFIEILPDLQKLGYSKLFDNAKDPQGKVKELLQHSNVKADRSLYYYFSDHNTSGKLTASEVTDFLPPLSTPAGTKTRQNDR